MRNRYFGWAVLFLIFFIPGFAYAQGGKATFKVGVLYFENIIRPEKVTPAQAGLHTVDPQYDYLERALTDMLTTDLAAFPQAQLLERARIEKLLEEIKFGESGLVDEKTIPKRGLAVEGDFLIYGQLDKKKGKLIVKTKIIDISKGKIHSLKEVSGAEEDVLMIAEGLKSTVADFLGLEQGTGINAFKPEREGSLAVLPFYNNSKTDKLGHLRQGLPAIFINKLIKLGRFTIVERARINSVMQELGLQQSGLIDEKTAVKIGKLLGAKYLLLGMFIENQGIIRIDIRVIETETGRAPILASITSENEDKLFSAIEIFTTGDFLSLR
ncbi:MAG: hypothetical protein FD156_2381 [Nitrospirae bacterium]|nr:MAG: hypothetical protein FD156_2381 [Nitrospirota bacterium]